MDDETLALILLTLVDEWYQQEGASMVLSRPGPKPQCTDTEILVLSLLRLLIARMFGKALSPLDAEWMLEHEVPGWRLADKVFSPQDLVERLKACGQYLLIPPKYCRPSDATEC